jgi:CBS domain-containing protein
MKRRLVFLAALAHLALVELWAWSDALAQGLPAPGPGTPTLPAADGGNMMAPAIILALALLCGLILAVAIVDLKRKRRAEGVAIESQIADALMREPRLMRSGVTSLAHVPLSGRSGLTVEVRGEVEYPELRETAVRIVRQELLRYHPDARVEDRIFVSPPIPAGRH